MLLPISKSKETLPLSDKLNGILILDKPIGYTSNQALQKVKHLYGGAKIGHTGTLDPLATGVLPLFFGQTTRLSQFLLNSDKSYQFTVQFGSNTTTGDSQGTVLDSASTDHINKEKLEQAVLSLSGVLEQTPPQYSAIKVEGKPMHYWARRDCYKKLESRQITIYAVTIEDFACNQSLLQARIALSCSKGTYIRSWAEDLGKILGCGAHIVQLRRTAAGMFTLNDAIDFEVLKLAAYRGGKAALSRLLLNSEHAAADLPCIKISYENAHKLRLGQFIQVLSQTLGFVGLCCENGSFVGVGRIDKACELRPYCIFRSMN